MNPEALPPTTCFEVSWEVCNKVGGIYTVVSSKARHAAAAFDDRYFLLGPDLKRNPEFAETDEPEWAALRAAAASRDIRCRFGRWTIPGRPRVILVALDKPYNQGQLLYELWETYGVDSLSGGWDYLEPVRFSYACGEVINAAHRAMVQPAGGRSVAHFHEWMCGAGLLAVKKETPEIGTVFTTHATVLGRSLAGSGVDIYRQMDHLSPPREASAHHVVAKCSMETAAARESDCFTTVSDITAVEARSFLGRAPDAITTNGLDMTQIPDRTANREAPDSARRKILEAASLFLRKPLPASTRLIGISGRYEFHNKGVDVFLEALGGLDRELRTGSGDQTVLALCMILGGYEGLNVQAVQGDLSAVSDQGAGWIATHRLYNQSQDPILTTCNRLGLVNGADNRVHVIFIPAFLDGADGFLNLPYYEALAACDLGVFPSYYEPWGYTPQESAAFAVPTVTTDLAGFGLWARRAVGDRDGIAVLRRKDQTDTDVAKALETHLRDAITAAPERLLQRRREAREAALGASWDHFFPLYLDAYDQALKRAAQRAAQAETARLQRERVRSFAPTGSATPYFRTLTAVARLPAPLSRLRELAYNLWWTWHPEALDLFAEISPSGRLPPGSNPVRAIETADPRHLEQLAQSQPFLERYAAILKAFDAYMSGELSPLPPAARIRKSAPIAYFSAEYGLHEGLPIYSGGLGVLSGDHLKAASDLRLPLIGVGLLYKCGYFTQRVDRHGRQIATFPENDFSMLPVRLMKDNRGDPLEITVELPGRTLFAYVWEIAVGRVPLYLLDTDTPKNTDDDRGVTRRLYAPDPRTRIKQELLLGIGGERLLRKLAIRPSVYHLNEGHSAFTALERIRAAMAEEGLSFWEAAEWVRGQTVFTTHTPVAAGNETFPRDIVEYYLGHIVQKAGLAWSDFWDLGRLNGSDDGQFHMTVLALKTAARANGVSRLHGAVARHMWQPLWHGVPEPLVPIGAVTNGVHLASVVAPRMKALLDGHLGAGWERAPADAPVWNQVDTIPDEALWAAKTAMKEALLERIREQVTERLHQRGASRAAREAALSRLDPRALLLVFARRFAPYKRATLILSDPNRLAALLQQPDRPILLVFAGKAHPEDVWGQELIQTITTAADDPRFAGRLLFLEDYDLGLARALVQGADVWLNTPRRPHEACGTSGQKALVNATLNLSVADGWWSEAADDRVGWTIGPTLPPQALDETRLDEADAESLYATLEERVVPLFFDRDTNGLPRGWIARAKLAVKTLAPHFNADRMVREYVNTAYLPAAARGAELSRKQAALARRLADWKRTIPTRFATVRLLDIRVEGPSGDAIAIGHPLTVNVRLDPGKLARQELLVQLLIGPADGRHPAGPPDVVTLQGAPGKNGALEFSGAGGFRENGRHVYGVRVMPMTEGLENPQETGLVLWG